MKRFFWLLFFLAFALNSVKLQAEPVEVKVILDRQYYPVALKAIKEAKESINFAVFEIRYYPEYPQSFSNRLIDGLILAAQRGVNVEVCLEQSKGYNQDNALDNVKVAYKLINSGVKTYLDNPKKTLHAKFLVVDRRLVLLGSTNWAYYSLDKNWETNLLVDSRKIAEELLGYFETIKKDSKLFKP
ncbi:MAG: phospholipase D-like domain-containing protein [Candidatus Ratteibacteria bacterium]|jgi:phosphatidylserine/phosphatidylglycerophosphate/cardiolipin synthase-like enzyme